MKLRKSWKNSIPDYFFSCATHYICAGGEHRRMHFIWLFKGYHRNLQEIDSAFYNFSKASESLNDKTEYLHGNITDNIADVYLTKGQGEKARELHYQNFLLYKSGTLNLNRLDIKRSISAGCQFITTSIALNNFSKVDDVYNELPVYLATYTDPEPDEQDKLQFFKAEEKLLLFRGRAYQAASVSRNIRQLRDADF